MVFLHPCQRKAKQGASSAPDAGKGSMQTKDSFFGQDHAHQATLQLSEVTILRKPDSEEAGGSHCWETASSGIFDPQPLALCLTAAVGKGVLGKPRLDLQPAHLGCNGQATC